MPFCWFLHEAAQICGFYFYFFPYCTDTGFFRNRYRLDNPLKRRIKYMYFSLWGTSSFNRFHETSLQAAAALTRQHPGLTFFFFFFLYCCCFFRIVILVINNCYVCPRGFGFHTDNMDYMRTTWTTFSWPDCVFFSRRFSVPEWVAINAQAHTNALRLIQIETSTGSIVTRYC